MQANYTPNKKTQRVFVAGRVVGTVKGGIFKKSIQFSKHALRTPPALALSVESLTLAQGFGAHEIEITDKESGRVYTCSISHFLRYSWQIQRSGFEPQRALSLERWTVTLSEHNAPAVATSTVQPVYTESTVAYHAPVQLGLFK